MDIKKLLPWIGGATLIFILSWYLAVKYAIVVIAAALGFAGGMAFQAFRNKKQGN
ncbi:MAG: hypothetical protein M1579_03435 [Gammaproteobacteria bacterium]|nr:hypothetical protein [Gammaproteobacteria bacterium]